MRGEAAARERRQAPPGPPRPKPAGGPKASRRLEVPRVGTQQEAYPPRRGGGGFPPAGKVAPPPRRLPLQHRRPVILVAAVGVGIAVLVLAGRLGSGAEDRLGTLTVDELAVGDCFLDPLREGQIEGTVATIETVACSQPHDAEVYATLDHPAEAGQTFIGGEAMSEFADEGCREAFEPAIGRAYEESRFDIATIVPTRRSWSEGDREVTCWALPGDGEPLTGTVRGSGE